MSTESISGSSPAEETPPTGGTGGPEKASDKQPPSMDAPVGDLNKFRQEYPELWNKIMMGWAQEMTSKMRKDQENLKKLMREAQRR
jgi:hypothetical protein